MDRLIRRAPSSGDSAPINGFSSQEPHLINESPCTFTRGSSSPRLSRRQSFAPSRPVPQEQMRISSRVAPAASSYSKGQLTDDQPASPPSTTVNAS